MCSEFKTAALGYCTAAILFFAAMANAQSLERKDCGLIEFNAINEASGIAASWRNPGILWTHNDSGDRNRLFALDSTGSHRGVFILSGARNRDWEDIAVGPGPVKGQSCIYIADIGDNKSKHYTKYIYRVAEPEVKSAARSGTTVLGSVATFAFQYPDGNRDAEALLVDPLTQDIYIVSKREERVHVYRASWPQPFSETGFRSVTLLEFICELPASWINAGDISPDGRRVLLKNPSTLFLWERNGERPLEAVFQQAPEMLPYIQEPLGEAVCWQVNGNGYYTISEEIYHIPARLYYYQFRRK